MRLVTMKVIQILRHRTILSDPERRLISKELPGVGWLLINGGQQGILSHKKIS